MLRYPQIDPIAVSIGPLKIHWYGLTYLVGFVVGWWLGRIRTRKPWSPINEEQMGDLLFYIALGVVLGGRFGYVIFYNFDTFLADPLWLFRVWEGGMSFHGGLIGVMLAMWWFGRKVNCGFFAIADFVAPLVPIGLGAGRIGNFINGELWGRHTDVPWAMVFPTAPDALPRHPSQLYEFAMEGVLLFIILWVFSSKQRPRMAVSGLFLVGYACFRILAEFFRQPDVQLGFLAFDWVTMGQILSLPMLLAGIVLMVWAYRSKTQ
ncbi:prolipoprotein diacylglyceryl transferase [Marinobacter sp. NFXS9]|uniref:prolipoprotein diacylglyceryl transferase n=1 Tax=Marinobacter sp. NFXS9 TaxID=2818433 RepID=UPI0032DEC998